MNRSTALVIMAIVFLGVLSLHAEEEAAPLTGVLYSSPNGTFPDWKDLTGKQLTDGILQPTTRSAGGKVVRNSVIFTGGKIVVDLRLAGDCRVEKIIAHCYRHNMNYKLSHLILLAKEQGQWVERGRARGFWGDTKERYFPISIGGLNIAASELRLEFNTPSILSLAEVQVFGKRIGRGNPTAGGQALYGANVPLVNDENPSARETDVDGDGDKEVILENKYIRLILDPSHGGVMKGFFYKKTKKELAFPYGGAQSRFGVFRDQLWSPSYTFAELFYFHRIENRDDRASVELWTTGKGGILSFTEIRKTITLFRNRSLVRADYELKNSPSSQTDYEYGWWFHNFAGVLGEKNTYFFPTTEGVKEYSFAPGQEPDKPETWYYNPARGWTATVGESGTGFAADVDYRYLNCFYHWASASCLVPTLEWRFNKIRVASGDSLKTTCLLCPFSGVKRVDGAFNGVVGGLDVPSEIDANKIVPMSLDVSATEAGNLSLTLRYRVLPNGEWKAIGAKDVSLKADRVSRWRTTLPGLSPGTVVVNCQVKDDDKIIGAFERPIVVGGVKLAYKLEPEAERIGVTGPEAQPTLAGHELSDALVTDHVSWAKPYYRAKVKALILTDDHESREIIELAQRLDLDFTYTKFLATSSDRSYLYQGDRSIRTLAQAQARLKEKLKDRYDVIVISGLEWGFHFDKEIREHILNEVSNGAGFIYISPIGVDDALAKIPVFKRGAKKQGAWDKWSSTQDHYLTRSLPWDILPRTKHLVYESPPEGEVLATLGPANYPLLIVGEHGKGRVLSFTYDVYSHVLSYRGYTGLTPILSYRGAFMNSENAKIGYHYWEYHHALLARSLLWAAKKESDVEVLKIDRPDALDRSEAADEGVEITLASPGDGRTLTVTCAFRDEWSNLIAEAKQDMELAKPEQKTTIPLPSKLRDGLNLVDVIVRDQRGRSLAWGAAHFRVRAQADIAEIKWRRTELDPGDPAAGSIAISGEIEAERHSLELALYDSYNRLIGYEKRRPAGENPIIEFSFTLEDLVTPGIELRVSLFDGDTIIDTASSRALVKPIRDWKKLSFISWNAQYKWRSCYLFPYVSEQVRRLGLDVVLGGFVEEHNGKFWTDLWYGVQWSPLGLLSYVPSAPDFPDKRFSEKASGYAKTKDKKFLVREPCLNDPDYREKVAAHVRDYARSSEKYGYGYDYCMGDEMSLTHYTRYHDYCFSQHCLKKFRSWLAERYKDLPALNKQWDTDFASWGDVTPMTADEARGRGNYSPWADHRTFMEDTLADFFAMVLENLKAVDPDAKAGLSGTQAPEAGNGMDWWKLSHAFNYYHSYNTALSEEMRRSFKKSSGVMSAPYFAGYWLAGRRLESRLWYCLLHDSQSISAWTTSLFFYGDLTFSESGRDTRDGLAELKSGVWDLIRQAKRQNDGIAIHYSQPSVHAAYILGRDSEFRKCRSAWVNMLTDMGLQFDFAAYEEIEQGALMDRGYKVLILPESTALSRKECSQIRRFVSEGGLVIGDAWIGEMDDHCRTLEAGGLDDLFGIKRTASKGDSRIPTGIQLGSAIGGLPGNFEVRLAAAQREITARTATALAKGADEIKTPALLVNSFGKGTAVYLNMSVSQYNDDRKFHSPTEKQLLEIISFLLAKANVSPKVKVVYSDGEQPHCEVARYIDGDAEYVGVIREFEDGAKEKSARINFGREAYVYDVRARKPLGRADHATAVLAAGQAKLYALLLQAIDKTALKIQAPDSVRIGDKVEYKILLKGGPRSRARVFRVDVAKPSGEVFKAYGRNFIVRGEKEATASFRLALNDETGKWKLKVREVAPGALIEHTLKVTERKAHVFKARGAAMLERPGREKWQMPNKVVEALRLKEGDAIADVGCGSGYFTTRFAEKAGDTGKVFAVDIQEKMLDIIRKKIEEKGYKNIVPVLSEPLDTHLQESSVDMVFICNTYHEVPNGVAFLKNIHSAVKPGGSLVILDFKKIKTPMGPPLARRISPERMIEEAAKAGFVLSEKHEFLQYQYFLRFVKRKR